MLTVFKLHGPPSLPNLPLLFVLFFMISCIRGLCDLPATFEKNNFEIFDFAAELPRV